MKPIGFTLFTFFNASFFSLLPVAVVVLLPNFWWGIIIKAVAVLWLLGAVGSLLKAVPANQMVYGGSAPGFVINMLLFATALSLDHGIFRSIAIYLFLFVSVGNCLMIYSNAKKTRGSSDAN